MNIIRRGNRLCRKRFSLKAALRGDEVPYYFGPVRRIQLTNALIACGGYLAWVRYLDGE